MRVDTLAGMVSIGLVLEKGTHGKNRWHR
jgi:hypothetical protein